MGTTPRSLDIEVVNVSPALAKEWLGLNSHNRAISKRAVERYAHDMVTERWAFAGDPIRFNGKGQLIDGQHRLHACVMADKTFMALVIRNLPLEVQESLDQGRARQARDHLALRGYASSTLLAATARHLLFIKGTGRLGPTNADVMQAVERHPRLADSVEFCNTSKIMGITPSLLTAIHYIGAHLLDERERADAFANVFASGEPDYVGDPAHLWRERWLADSRRSSHMTRAARRMGSIHVWNQFRARTAVTHLRLPETATIDGLDTAAI
jgi:hypothetical protein